MEDVYIYDYVRTPIGDPAPSSPMHKVTAVDLVVQLMCSIRQRNESGNPVIEDVILGCQFSLGEAMDYFPRICSLRAHLGAHIPGLIVDRKEHSGLEALAYGASRILTGQNKMCLAGGIHLTYLPMSEQPKQMWTLDPKLVRAGYALPQVVCSELLAKNCGVALQECQSYVIDSHKKAARAWAEGVFQNSFIPLQDYNAIPILERDECLRLQPESVRQRFSTLSEPQNAFSIPYETVVTKVHPCLDIDQLDDHRALEASEGQGAALLLLGTKEWASQGMFPMAKLRGAYTIGSDSCFMIDAGVKAAECLLNRLRIGIGQVDLFLVHENFAMSVLYFCRKMNVDLAKVNVNGGILATGNPKGAAGSMLVGNAVEALKQSKKEFAMVILSAHGIGSAMLIQRV